MSPWRAAERRSLGRQAQILRAGENTMSNILHRSLETLFRELIDGPDSNAAWMLNAGDAGLLRSLDKLTASAASASSATDGASIAAHVDHVRYGLSLMNRWSQGEHDPWSTADWRASWNRSTVNNDEWASLRQELGTEARGWLEVLRAPRDYSESRLNDALASIAHLAYHFGAIRQIDRSIRGPAAS